MSYRDPAFQLRDLSVRKPRAPQSDADELLPLSVAAAIAYGRLIGDPTQVRAASLEDRLQRIELALSAVATVYAGGNGEDLLRRQELMAAIELLRRAGIAI